MTEAEQDSKRLEWLRCNVVELHTRDRDGEEHWLDIDEEESRTMAGFRRQLDALQAEWDAYNEALRHPAFRPPEES